MTDKPKDLKVFLENTLKEAGKNLPPELILQGMGIATRDFMGDSLLVHREVVYEVLHASQVPGASKAAELFRELVKSAIKKGAETPSEEKAVVPSLRGYYSRR